VRLSKAAQLKATAYHEAGHAMLAWALGLPVLKASIVGDSVAKGRVTTRTAPLSPAESPLSPGNPALLRKRDLMERRAMQALAGRLAQERATGRSDRIGGLSDESAAMIAMAQVTTSPEERTAYLHLLKVRARFLLDLWWESVEAIATGLLGACLFNLRLVLVII
jgi:ATP-dependent Zn protease